MSQIDTHATQTAIIATPAATKLTPTNGTRLLPVSPKAITRFLAYCIAFLFLAHLCALYLDFRTPVKSHAVKAFDHFFNVNEEANFPTFFSVFLLLFAAGILYFLYKTTSNENKKDKKFWFSLSLIFVYLCFDEAAQIHERLTLISRNYIKNDLSGYLHWTWVIPYTVLTVIVGLYFLKFVLRLPKKTRNLFFIAAFIYVFGAVALEMIEGHCGVVFGPNHYSLIVCYTAQEIMEMVGITIFIYALLDYIKPSNGNITIKA